MAKKPTNNKNVKPAKKGKAPRNARGQLLPGHGGLPGAGRPRRQTETEYLDTLRETVTLDDWRAICRAMVSKAKRGDVRAFEALCKWAMPKQTQEDMPDFDPPDLGDAG